ncbi:MAG: SH3-like domain-containing protein, partial [Alphaproteobacteria bacterium]
MTAPRFAAGDLVRVDHREHEGHCRTPSYLRGRVGRVDCLLGTFRNPEALAYFGAGEPAQPLYVVRFRQADLWPGYAGGPNDTLAADIYEHW